MAPERFKIEATVRVGWASLFFLSAAVVVGGGGRGMGEMELVYVLGAAWM